MSETMIQALQILQLSCFAGAALGFAWLAGNVVCAVAYGFYVTKIKG